MSWMLNVVYLAVLAVASPLLLYAAVFKGKYREGFAEKFLGRAPPRESNRPCIWLHAVSVGEVNLLATLLDELERRRPDVECVISTTTMTGYALAKKKYASHTVSYCPLDFTWAVNTAMRRVRPDLLLLAELELWPNLISAAKRHGANVAVVNGRLSENSHRGYRRVGWLVRKVLSQIDVIAAQNEEYAARFQALSRVGTAHQEPPRAVEPVGDAHPTVCVTGSLKFDGAQTDRNNPKTRELAKLAGLAVNDTVFLAGSTQAPEEELALATFTALQNEHPNLRLILVPRHPDRFDEVAALLDDSGLPWQRRSELVTYDGLPRPSNETGNDSTALEGHRTYGSSPRILLVDTIGELGAWWGTAHIAYVGGSMGSRGGQNMIEPAAYGAAVAFGPNTKNFRDIVQMLLASDAAQVVADGAALTEFVRRCLKDAPYAKSLGDQARRLVLSGTGATRKSVDLLLPLLPNSAGTPASELRRAG